MIGADWSFIDEMRHLPMDGKYSRIKSVCQILSGIVDRIWVVF